MHPRKYFTLNFFINELFSVEKFPNYGITQYVHSIYTNTTTDLLFISYYTYIDMWQCGFTYRIAFNYGPGIYFFPVIFNQTTK